jgi:hypothetical protein
MLGARLRRALCYKKSMIRGFVLWAGSAAVLAVVVAAVVVAAFPREPTAAIELPAIAVTPHPAAKAPVALAINVGTTAREGVVTAATSRGGTSTRAPAPAQADAGAVGYKSTPPATRTRASVQVTPIPFLKPAANRQTSLGAQSGNADAGLAGG